jgi:tRNA(adenine34) deaminase
MCAGAIVQARLDGLVIGAFDFKAGAAGSVYNIVQDRRLNHRVRVVYGVMQEECSELLKRFFYEKR